MPAGTSTRTIGSVDGSFFTVERRGATEWFRPADACRGPWASDACHAGPPTGLLARAAEHLVPGQRLTRLTVDLTRPIPHAGFSIACEITRAGRSVTTSSLSIDDGDGRQVVTASAMHVAPGASFAPPSPSHDTPRLADARPDDFPIREASHGLPWFRDGLEVRYPPGEGPSSGPTTLWMRTVPLLPDESPSGFQRIAPLADCGNAISRNAEADEVSFVNTDLTVVLHREPVGEWLGADAVSRWEANGLGMSDSLLFDELGPVGRALQTLLLRTR